MLNKISFVINNEDKKIFKAMPVKSRTTDTFEYRKETIRPRVFIRDVEMGECPESVFFKELKKIVNGRFYHTTDTNRFFFDWNDKRYELNLFGESGGEIIDYNQFAKKTDIPKKTSQLTNDSGFITKTSLSDFLSRNKYVTSDMLAQSVSSLVGIDVFNSLSSDVEGIKTDIENLKQRIDSMTVDSDLNQEISDLINKVSSFETELETLTQKIDDLTSDSEFGEGISGLNERISSLENNIRGEIESINQRLDELTSDSEFENEISNLNERISNLDNDIRNEIEGINQRLDEFSSDSDFNDELSRLSERVSALEEMVAEEGNWDEFERE